MLIVGGWLGWIVHDAHVQHDAVQVIKNAGGMVSYEWEWKSGRYDWKARPRCPKWLLDMIGVDYAYNVKMVDVSSVITNPDVVLAQVARLSRLEILQLETSRVTDIGMAKLDTLTELRSLMIYNGPEVGDHGIARRTVWTAHVASNALSLRRNESERCGVGLRTWRG